MKLEQKELYNIEVPKLKDIKNNLKESIIF